MTKEQKNFFCYAVICLLHLVGVGRLLMDSTTLGSGAQIGSVEEHAAISKGGLAVSDDRAKKIALGAYEILALRDKELEGKLISAEEADSILQGDEGAKALFKKYPKKQFFVNLENLEGYTSIADFAEASAFYAKHGRKLTEDRNCEILKTSGEPMRDVEGNPLMAPCLLVELLREVAAETGVDPDIDWAKRDHNLQAVMWSRTRMECTENPTTWIKDNVTVGQGKFGLIRQAASCGSDDCLNTICAKAIRWNVAKPYGDHDSGFAFDINNWERLSDALAKRGFVGGCDSKLAHDKRHFSIALGGKDSSKWCKFWSAF